MSLSVFVGALLLSFFASAQILRTPEDRLRVLSWNVENLYDHEHDPGRDDWEYLPHSHPMKKMGCLHRVLEKYRPRCLETDWTQDKVILKLQQIKRKLDSVGARPDVFAVLEVENERVVRALAQVLGYSWYVITQNDDERGIDQALLFSEKPGFQFRGSQEIPIRLRSRTRPILQVSFEFQGYPLHIFVNHWPATAAPTAQRVVAAETLRQAIDRAYVTESPRPTFVAAVGDFNVTPENRPYPFDILHDPRWSNSLVDLDHIARQFVMIPIQGSYFVPGQMRWSLLDRIFLSKNFFDQKQLRLPVNRYQIVTTFTRPFVSRPDPTTGQVQREGQIPMRYNPHTLDPKKAGFSDHFPVMFEIVKGS